MRPLGPEVALFTEKTAFLLALARDEANIRQLLFSQSLQILQTDLTFTRQLAKYKWQLRVAVIVRGIDGFAAARKIVLQPPQVGWFLDVARHFLHLMNDLVQFLLERLLKHPARNLLLRIRPP